MSVRDFVRSGVLVWSFWMLAAPAAAQGVGAIGGTVTDASGAVLPGVTVTLSNPRGTIGGNQETVTDARGAFQFIRLVPGTYTVKADLAGFRPAVQENVVVNADVDRTRRSEAGDRHAVGRDHGQAANRRCSTRRRR